MINSDPSMIILCRPWVTRRKPKQSWMNGRSMLKLWIFVHFTVSERERYLADWAAVQSKFVDEPGQAIVDADRLIMEVMKVRAYPVSDFEQRAADISVNYPALVSNYRAAREIALKNEQHQARYGRIKAGHDLLPVSVRGTSRNRDRRCKGEIEMNEQYFGEQL